MVPSASFRETKFYIFLGVLIFCQIFALAYLIVASATLLSKFVPKEKQATIQGELKFWRL